MVGLVAGWLAGKIVRGTGFGLIGDLVLGIIGVFIGDWLLPRVGIHLGTGIVSAIINATIGAVLLLLVVRLHEAVAVSGAAGADADGGSGQKRESPAHVNVLRGLLATQLNLERQYVTRASRAIIRY